MTSPVVLSGTTPGTAVVTVNVTSTYGRLISPQIVPAKRHTLFAILFPFSALLLLPLATRRKMHRFQRSGRLLSVLLLFAAFSITGCGGASSSGSSSLNLPPAGTQVITITANANGATITSTFTVNVTN